MGKIIIDVSPSVDGFLAGPGVHVERPFGTAGHRLHRWLGFEGAAQTAADREAAERMFATAGAVVIGRTMFEVGIGTWGDDGAFGVPSFVVTHRPHADVHRNPTTFTFVTDGVAETVSQAREAAGDRDVVVAGGASVIQQCLNAGLVDEIRLHVAPVLLSSGTRLFDGSATESVELEHTATVATALATHQTYRIAREGADR